MTANGTRLFGTRVLSHGPTGVLAEYSAETGRRIMDITQADESGMGTQCEAEWSAPSGDQVAGVCGNVKPGWILRSGHVTSGYRFISLGQASLPQDFVAW
jgi:hypothetical protein